MRNIDYIDEISSLVLDNDEVCTLRSVEDEDDSCSWCVIFEKCTHDANVANLDTICYRIYVNSNEVRNLTNRCVNLNNISYNFMNVTAFNKSLYSAIWIRNKVGHG